MPNCDFIVAYQNAPHESRDKTAESNIPEW